MLSFRVFFCCIISVFQPADAYIRVVIGQGVHNASSLFSVSSPLLASRTEYSKSILMACAFEAKLSPNAICLLPLDRAICVIAFCCVNFFTSSRRETIRVLRKFEKSSNSPLRDPSEPSCAFERSSRWTEADCQSVNSRR